MPEQAISDRWPISCGRDQLPPGKLIHARLHGGDDLTLCEKGDGTWLEGTDNVTLVLDHPATTPEDRALINCPACVAWLRA